MRLIDTYFKAFIEYRKHTLNNNDAIRARKIVKQANKKDETLTITKYTCKIEEDFIKEIEEGLIFVEKAIFEERQFIRSDGDVVNIEKVKKTSKDSVEHLSKNSNFITRLPEEGETLIPDKLYIVEKLSDYAVYENRFLYLLLTTLRDFLDTRISRIKEKVTTYHAKMDLKKEIKFNNRNVSYNLEFSDTYNNDPYLTKKYYNIPLIKRLENSYYTVEALLRTALMVEVSKAQPLKPPVTKTNVLRMNPNFKIAMSLYEYINSYTKDGYSFSENVDTYNPLNSSLSDEFSDVIELSTFLVYSHGNEIIDDLKSVYDKELVKQELLLAEKRKQELLRLKKRVSEMGLDYLEYISILEKVNKDLEKRNEQIEVLEKLNLEYSNLISELTLEKNDLINDKNNLIEETNSLNNTILENNEKHRLEIIDLENKHETLILELINNHKELIDKLKEEHEEYLIELKKLNEEVINDLNEKNMARINILENNFNEERLRLNEEIKVSYQNINSAKKEYADFKKENELVINDFKQKITELTDEKNYTIGKFYAYKQKDNNVTSEDDLSSKERFKELELVKKSFDKFFSEQWKNAKKQIKENVKNEVMNDTKE